MNFQKKELSSVPTKKAKSKAKCVCSYLCSLPKKMTNPTVPKWKRWTTGVFTAACALFIIWIFYVIFNFFAHFSLGEVFQLFGKLEVDKNNNTQILVLGSGDASHDSPDLTDTIMVASLNHDTNTVSVVSIPRDLWVETPQYGGMRINGYFEAIKNRLGSKDQAYQELKKIIGTLIGQDIHYFSKVDFKVFRDLVDTAGGVDITLDYELCDEHYPDENLIGYSPFCIEAGDHHIDGEMALRLARSRKGVHLDENGRIIAYSSDFDRAARQQMIVKALKNKILTIDMMTSPTKIKGLWDTYSANVETDLGFQEIWALAGFASKMDDNSIAKAVLHVNEMPVSNIGGFLYYPVRELYGGASVIRPLGEDFTEIQNFINIFFNYPLIFTENARIEILNGTGTPGLATTVMNMFAPYGFNIERIGNTDDDIIRKKTIIYLPAENPENPEENSYSDTVNAIKNFLGSGVVMRRQGNYTDDSIDITIEVGQDAERQIK